ncbi:hypothetical protein COLO4_28889 [Corchorus olitorius]|uniref:Uncharacterized protein n=1 Tax=Corchorus olitorius TaxID=93759 RepID=A0A1R3HHV1_9ROSI|nr:hypothetical protein COLO4_28889 [Corchorus olitorius]
MMRVSFLSQREWLEKDKRRALLSCSFGRVRLKGG